MNLLAYLFLGAPEPSGVGMKAMAFSLRFSFSLSIFVALSLTTSWGNPREVVNLKYGSPGSTKVLVGGGASAAGTRNHVTAVGDVDGDGFVDILYDEEHPENLPAGQESHDLTVLIYGARALPEVVGVAELRKTIFINDEEGGIRPSSHPQESPFASAGDIDRDGFDDFLVGASYYDADGIPRAGLILLIFGQADFPQVIPFRDLEGSGVRSIRFLSEEPNVYIGQDIQKIGDLDADGFPEFAFSTVPPAGVLNGRPAGGRVYVIGGAFAHSADISLSEVGQEVPGFVLHGAYGSDRASGYPDGDQFGSSLSFIDSDRGYDLNGDGFGDFVIGAERVSRNGIQRRGAVYIVFGRKEFASEYLSSEPGDFGVEILGERSLSYFGKSVAIVGDVDGDGLDDFVVGAPAASFAGVGYLIYGAEHWQESISVEDPSLRTLKLQSTRPPFLLPVGSDSNNNFGYSVASVGDWNQDGFPDFLIGAFEEYQGLSKVVGAAYLVYGGPNLPREALDVDLGTPHLPGIHIQGPRPYGWLGYLVKGGVDFNGDGKSDFMVTNPVSFLPAIMPDHACFHIFYGGTDLVGHLGLAEVKPTRGFLTGGTHVSLGGSGFQDNMIVLIGGQRAPVIDCVSTAELIVELPPRREPGVVKIEVLRGDEEAVLESAFEYVTGNEYPDIHLDDGFLESGPYASAVLEYFSGVFLSEQWRNFLNCQSGDLNGDGVDDLVVGAVFDGSPVDGWNRGELLIVFGRGQFPKQMSWGEDDGGQSRIEGDPELINFGQEIALPGDLDRDGVEDLVVGGTVIFDDSFLPSDLPGRSYVIFGGSEWKPHANITELIAEGRSVMIEHSACARPMVAPGGDVDGSGRESLLVGNSHCAGAQAVVRVFSGDAEYWTASPEPISVIHGDPELVPWSSTERARKFGYSVSGAGDMNGDGIDDFVVGAEHRGPGAAYIILGGDWNGELSIVELQAQGRAVVVRQRVLSNNLGWYVASAGDFNGDGLADALLGDHRGGTDREGECFVMFGSPDLGRDITDFEAHEPGRDILALVGEDPGDAVGWVSGLGDWNGDGIDDVAVAGLGTRSLQSRAYVVFGEPEPPREVSLGDLAGRGFKITLEPRHWFSGGDGALTSGDWNDDGALDLVFGEMTPQGKRVVFIFGSQLPLGPGIFVRGEANEDLRIDLSDAVFVLEYLFLGGKTPPCADAADVNDSGAVDLSDAVYLLSYLFLGGPPPPPPFGEPGTDRSEDELNCRGEL